MEVYTKPTCNNSSPHCVNKSRVCSQAQLTNIGCIKYHARVKLYIKKDCQFGYDKNWKNFIAIVSFLVFNTWDRSIVPVDFTNGLCFFNLDELFTNLYLWGWFFNLYYKYLPINVINNLPNILIKD